MGRSNIEYIVRQGNVRYALIEKVKETIKNFDVKDVDKAYKNLDTDDIVFALSSIIHNQTNNEQPKTNKLP